MDGEDDDFTDYVFPDDDPVSFDRSYCTCDHEPDEHGWIGCMVDDCDCDAGWEE